MLGNTGMSRKKFITMFEDSEGNNSMGKFVVEGIEVTEERKYSTRTVVHRVCVVCKPSEVAERWDKLAIDRSVVELPRNLQHIPPGFVTSKTFARIWERLWKDEVYECRWPALREKMFDLPDNTTWYAQGTDLHQTGRKLLDIDV